MCYAAPGPRCSSHASIALNKSKKDVSLASRNIGVKQHELSKIDPQDKEALAAKQAEVASAHADLFTAMREKREVQSEYDKTPAGIKALRSQGKFAAASTAAAMRKDQIDHYNYVHGSTDPKKATAVPRWDDRVTIAENDSSTPEVIAALAKDDDPSVRCAAAGNPNATALTLDRLALDSNEQVRRAVARNANISDRTLLYLACESEPDQPHGYEGSAFYEVGEAARENPRYKDAVLHGASREIDVDDSTTFEEQEAAALTWGGSSEDEIRYEVDYEDGKTEGQLADTRWAAI